MKLQPDDYYIENGSVVFTENYLLRRGICCKKRCRHCPYKGQPDNEQDQELSSFKLKTKVNEVTN